MFSRFGLGGKPGIQDDIMIEGLHLRVPWFQYPIIYDIRSRPRKMSSPTGSKDLQMVNISLRVLSRPDANSIPTIHKELGKNRERSSVKKNTILRGALSKGSCFLLSIRDNCPPEVFCRI